MTWDRSRTIGVADARCGVCHGLGMRQQGHRGDWLACKCVYRAAFRACLKKWIDIQAQPPASRRRAEFAADFELTARRNLNSAEYRLFVLHFLWGLDYRACCPRLGLDRGNFYRGVYRIEERLGRVYAELEPYALFPTRAYFTTRRALAGEIQ